MNFKVFLKKSKQFVIKHDSNILYTLSIIARWIWAFGELNNIYCNLALIIFALLFEIIGIFSQKKIEKRNENKVLKKKKKTIDANKNRQK